MKVNAKYQIKAFIMQHYKWLVLIFIVLFSQYTNLSRNMDRIRCGSLAGDYDGYWHLLRVQEIHHTGSWDNEINSRGNAPFGERIHWTHAMDVVLFGGAYIGSFFTDFDSSLYWFGVVVGPLLYVFSLIAIIFFGRVVLGAKRGIYLALLFAVNSSQAYVVYSVARPDHHCLLTTLFILYYFSFIFLLERPGAAALAVLTGMLGALGLWSGVEILILTGLSVLYLGILWIIYGDKYLNAGFMLTLALSVCLAVTVLMDEKPGNYWVAAYDKRSIVHVALFALIALYWLIVIILARLGVGKKASSRLMVGVGGSALLLAISLSLFPGIIKGPLSQMDPRLYALYLDRTSEFCTDIAMTAHNLLLVGPGLIYLAWIVYKAADKRRILFSWLILASCVYLGLSLTMNRWVFTLSVISLLPNALILIAMTSWQNTIRNAVLALVITMSLLIVPFLAPFALEPKLRTAPKSFKEYDSKVIDVLSFMESQDHTTDREIILANIFIGPAIMYRTSFNAVGTANHNNDKGIIDTYTILTAEDDSIAKALVDARGIDYILIDEKLKRFIRIKTDKSARPEDPPANGMFMDQLTSGQIPDWLIGVPLPEKLADTFWLYRVVEKNANAG